MSRRGLMALLLPLLLGNQPATCPAGVPGTVIDRQVRAELAPDVAAAMPRPFRYRVRTDQPLPWLGSDTVTVDSDRDLALHSRWSFAIAPTLTDDMSGYRTIPIPLSDCGVQPLAPAPAPAGGCAHCGGS